MTRPHPHLPYDDGRKGPLVVTREEKDSPSGAARLEPETPKPILKVVHLYSALQRTGGIERIIRSIAVRSRQHGIESSIFLFSRLPSGSEMPVDGVNIRYPALNRIYDRLGKLVLARSLTKLLRRIDITLQIMFSSASVLHIHRGMDQSSAFTALFCRLAGKRIVRTVHGNPPASGRNPFWWLRKQINKTVDAFVALTPDGKRYALENCPINPTSMHIIPNGVDLASFAGASDARDRMRRKLGVEDAFVILMVARLDLRQKDYFTLLRGFDLFQRRIPYARLLLCGDGPGRRIIELFVNNNCLADKVMLLGYYNHRNIPELMAASDVLAFSTFYEGFGLVAAEAMAARLPIVATDVVGLRSVCGNGDAAILTAPGSAEEMAAAFALLHDDAAARAQLIENGVALATREYDVDVMVRRYADLYRAIDRGVTRMTQDRFAAGLYES